jgi:fatty acid desaturase
MADAPISTAEQLGDTINDIPLQSSELLRKLIPFKLVNAIAGKRSNLEGFKQAAFHIGCMICTGVIIHLSFTLYNAFSSVFTFLLVAMAIILHGYVLSFLFMPLHEFVHMTAFKSPLANRLGGFITGLATLRPPFHYKLYHFAHHRFTGNKEKDPELYDSLLDPDIKTFWGYLLYLSSIPFWVSRPTTVIRHAIYGTQSIDPKGEYFISTDEQKEGIVGEARVFLLVYTLLTFASLYYRSTALLFYWAIPTVVGQPFLRYYLLAEHTGCQLGTNMMANTRTTKTYNFYRKLAWNMPFHAEHHAWPSVPFHHLPFVHSLLKGASLDHSGCSPTGNNGYFGVHKGVVQEFVGRDRSK